ncbi:hypothetical protein J1N35_006149 [Gossypium stocksii]|uniref:Outer envelope pore protein 16-3, chloroplastic/mitochondrial n=6 Tax=Gossypium TaxID=3633 RepID=A0A9D4AJA0_9ROSI|nr:hypothetical protein J1N35_006149 [Gossypium stocksii]
MICSLLCSRKDTKWLKFEIELRSLRFSSLSLRKGWNLWDGENYLPLCSPRPILVTFQIKMAVDPSELRYYEDDDTPTMKTIKGATTGFVAGTIWGTVVATWYDVPRVERSVAIPGLVRTLKMMGNYGMTFAAIGGVYIGVEQLLQNYRMKRDFVNGAVGGFVAGASILGFKGRSISTAISAGSALAFTSAVIDAGGQTTRLDTGKEYYPYTTKKRPVES